jgi:transposase
VTNSTQSEILEFILDTNEPLPTEPLPGVSVLVLWSVILSLVTLLQQVKAEVIELRAELRLARSKRFGQSSEKQEGVSSPGEAPSSIEPPTEEEEEAVDETDPMSSEVASDELVETVGDETDTSDEPKKRKRGAQSGHRGRGRHIPKHLPRIIRPVELPEAERHCPQCGQAYRETSLTEDSHEIDIQIQVRIIQYQRQRYERQCDCDGPRLVTAPLPPKLIPKGKFSVASWVKFLLDKYYANVPLNRQIASLQFLGLPLNLGTLIGGFKRLKDYLDPLYEHFLAHLRQATRLHADETRWRVFEEVKGKKGNRWWLWVFLSDEVVAYVLDPFRSTVAAKKALSIPLSNEEAAHLSQHSPEDDRPTPVIFWIEEQAYLLAPNLTTISADRYIVYRLLDDRIMVAFCWTHVRRDFVDFQKAHADQPQLGLWAESWIKDIALLYQLNDERLAVRSQPELFAQAQIKLEEALAEMKTKYDELDGLTLKQQKILTSLKKHWPGLTLFVTNPDIPMDNNVSERALRGPAGGRKTYYGHHAQWAGELAAMLFTIIQTCLLNNINPFTFLIYYFEECARLGAAPTDLKQFAPWELKQNTPPKLQLKPP